MPRSPHTEKDIVAAAVDAVDVVQGCALRLLLSAPANAAPQAADLHDMTCNTTQMLDNHADQRLDWTSTRAVCVSPAAHIRNIEYEMGLARQ